MSRDVTKQKADALQAVIYEGPTITGPPIKYGQIAEAMKAAAQKSIDTTLLNTRLCAQCKKDLTNDGAIWSIRGVDYCTDCGSGME